MKPGRPFLCVVALLAALLVLGMDFWNWPV